MQRPPDMAGTAAAPPAPRPLPWSIVRLLSASAAPVILVSAAIDPALAMAASGGLTVGMGAAMMGSLLRAACAAALVLLAYALGFAGLDPRVAALALAALAGLEAWRLGGRAVVLAVFAVALLAAASGAGAPPVGVGVCFAVAAGIGIGVVGGGRLAGIAAPPPETARGGLRVALFLALGLSVSLALIDGSDEPRTAWILYIFVLRALSPADAVTGRTLVYAAGALAGGVLGWLAAVLGPPPVWLSLAVAAALLPVGLRFAPLLSPIPGAAFTLAVLLVVAPGPGYAVFRIEAVLLVALLTLALAEGLQRLLGPRRG